MKPLEVCSFGEQKCLLSSKTNQKYKPKTKIVP